MADKTSSSSLNCMPTSLDKQNTVKTKVGEQDATVHRPPIVALTPLQLCRKRSESTPQLSLSIMDDKQTKSRKDNSIAVSVEETIISPELEAQFDGLFITTPPISPKTKSLPYLQRTQSPTRSFSVRKYTLPRRGEDTDSISSPKQTDQISSLADALNVVPLGPSLLAELRELEVEDILTKLTVYFRTSGYILRPHAYPGVNMATAGTELVTHYLIMSTMAISLILAAL